MSPVSPPPSRRRGILLILLTIAVLGALDLVATRDRNAAIPVDKTDRSPAPGDAITAKLALNVTIEPPDGGSAAPIALATPAGLLHQDGAVDVPDGAVVRVHLRQSADDEAPQILTDDQPTSLSAGVDGAFSATAPLAGAHRLSLRRGDEVIGGWSLSPQAAAPPHIGLSAPMTLDHGTMLHVHYDIDGELDTTKLAARLSLRDPPPGAPTAPVDIPIAIQPAKHLSGTADLDLGRQPWDSSRLSVQLVAANGWGAEAVSDASDITLPSRRFSDPTARMLIDERQKLLDKPDDRQTVSEVADMMAALSRQVAVQHGDPALVMVLREGAVRLILEPGRTGVASVADILWNIASAVETSVERAGAGAHG